MFGIILKINETRRASCDVCLVFYQQYNCRYKNGTKALYASFCAVFAWFFSIKTWCRGVFNTLEFFRDLKHKTEFQSPNGVGVFLTVSTTAVAGVGAGFNHLMV